MATTTQDLIDAKSKFIDDWLKESLLPRSLMKGTREMRVQGERFLPKDYKEKQENYDARLNRSFLVNAFGKTVSFLGGQVFQEHIVFNESFPQSFIEYNKDIDLMGNGINTFSKDIFETGLAEGAIHILIDTNNKDGEYTSKAEEKAAGIRPYFRKVKTEEILGGIIIGGVLVQLRLLETVEKQVGTYGTEVFEQIRVLEPGRWETHIKDNQSNWQPNEEGETSLDYIPFISFIPGKQTTLLTGKTPLMDLAELNEDHWQSNSDQKNILHFGRVPMLFGKMLDLESMKQSPHNMTISNDENGDLKYVEISGKAIEAGQKDLTETEAKMAMWGLQQLIPRTGNQTATEKAITSAESNSSLGSWATIFETFLEAAYEIMGEYDKENVPEDSLTVNKEFRIGYIEPQIITAYQTLVDAKILSSSSAFAELKRKGFLSDELDWVEVSAEILNESQNSSLMGDTLED